MYFSAVCSVFTSISNVSTTPVSSSYGNTLSITSNTFSSHGALTTISPIIVMIDRARSISSSCPIITVTTPAWTVSTFIFTRSIIVSTFSTLSPSGSVSIVYVLASISSSGSSTGFICSMKFCAISMSLSIPTTSNCLCRSNNLTCNPISSNADPNTSTGMSAGLSSTLYLAFSGSSASNSLAIPSRASSSASSPTAITPRALSYIFTSNPMSSASTLNTSSLTTMSGSIFMSLSTSTETSSSARSCKRSLSSSTWLAFPCRRCFSLSCRYLTSSPIVSMIPDNSSRVRVRSTSTNSSGVSVLS